MASFPTEKRPSLFDRLHRSFRPLPAPNKNRTNTKTEKLRQSFANINTGERNVSFIRGSRDCSLRSSMPAILRKRRAKLEISTSLCVNRDEQLSEKVNSQNMTIATKAELLQAAQYQVSLLRQRWSAQARHNFYAQLLQCKVMIVAALDSKLSRLMEMRYSWRVRHSLELELMKNAWVTYEQWLEELERQMEMDKDPLNPHCLARGRRLAERVEETVFKYFFDEWRLEERDSPTCFSAPPTVTASLTNGSFGLLSNSGIEQFHFQPTRNIFSSHFTLTKFTGQRVGRIVSLSSCSMNTSSGSSFSQQMSHEGSYLEYNPVEGESLAPEDIAEDDDTSSVFETRPSRSQTLCAEDNVEDRGQVAGCVKSLCKPPIPGKCDNQGDLDLKMDDFFRDESMQRELAEALSSPNVSFSNHLSFLSDGDKREDATLSKRTTSQPLHSTEVNTDSEECEDIIEIGGKQYRRRYKRHIKITRHRHREIIKVPANMQLNIVLAQNTENNPEAASNARGTTALVSPEIYVEDTEPSTNVNLQQQPQISSTFLTSPDRTDAPKYSLDTDMQRELNTVSHRVSTHLLHLFQNQWHKTESVVSPNDRSKTISCIRHYTQQSPTGQMLHRTMCVQQTRSLKTQKLKSDANEQIQDNKPFSVQAWLDKRQLGVFNPYRRLSDERVKDECELRDKCDRKTNLQMLEELDSYSSSDDSVLNEVRLSAAEKSQCLLLREFQYVRARGLWSHVLEQLDAAPYIHFYSPNESSISGHNSGNVSPLIPSNPPRSPGRAISIDTPLCLSIKAAPLDALLVYATFVGKMPDDFYLFYETFLTTYKMFSKVEDVIDKLIGRYAFFRLGAVALCDHPDLRETSPLSKLEETTRDKVCTVVLSVLINVVSHIHRDLSDEVETRLNHFLQCLYVMGDSAMADMLQQTLQKQMEERDRYVKRVHELEAAALAKQRKLNLFSNNHRGGSEWTESNSSRMSASISSTASLESTSSTTMPLSFQAVTVKRKCLLDFSPRALAEELTLIGEEKFDWIDIEDVFHSNMSIMGRPLCDHHNTLVAWTKTLLYSADREHGERQKYFQHLYEVSRELHVLHNYNAYIALILGLNDAPESVKPKRLKQKVKNCVSELLPINIRTAIYAEQMSISPPAILYMGLLYYLLAYLETNSAFDQPHPNCPELGPTISFWRYWRHFVIINFFYRRRMDSKRSLYSLQSNPEIRNFFNDFSDVLDENALSSLRGQLVSSKT